MPAPASSASTSGHALIVRDLSAGYQEVPVVRELNLDVRPGEVVALLGPNGAGKTTTLETIAGLNRPIAGTVEVSGENVGGTPAYVLARKGLALVPEGRALFPGLTVREHLRLAVGRGNQAGSREDELLEMLPELRKCLGRKAGLLSGGEQQMLAVGRALVTQPRLLLVDEMSLGLAPVIVERLLPILRRAADELGASVLFVEQHVALALEISDRAYILTHGRIRLEGAAAELRERRDLLAASSSQMVQRGSTRRNRADRGGLQFGQFGQFGQLGHSRVEQFGAGGQLCRFRHRQEGDRYPVRLRDDQ